MQRIVKWVVVISTATAAGLLLLWATSPDPQRNPASFEESELVMRIAPLEEAVTLAQRARSDGGRDSLLVLSLEKDSIAAIDLARLGAVRDDDPFVALASIPKERLAGAAGMVGAIESVAVADLLPAAPEGTRHIGTGTNFPEHAEEASSENVFMFPKFGAATPARTQVRADDAVLLDYEVELCMRFDRPVATVGDFDAAVKALFLCGDFTDRAKLLRLVDLDDYDSGRGFSDGKSREDFFPSGALLVIPDDWRSFVADERFMTFVNGDPRQDARGGEMTLDFRALAEKALGDMERPRFLYRDAYHRLSPQPLIRADMTLMSGTAEGVIFTPPSRGDIIEGAARYLLSGAWLAGGDPVAAIIETFLENEFASRHFLQAGDVVEFRSARLGAIAVEVTVP